MQLKYKSFELATDVLNFVEEEKINADNIINISIHRGKFRQRHFIWWKEEEKKKKYMVPFPGSVRGEYSLEDIEGKYVCLSDGESAIICSLVNEIRRLTK